MSVEKDSANLSNLLDLLNQTLELEYSLIVHYPRIANSIPNEEVKKLVNQLGGGSIAHLDAVANAITKLGGTPKWVIGTFPDETNMMNIFKIQLEKEETALRLHKRIAGLINDASLRDKFNNLAKEEEFHIKIIEQIIPKL